MFETLNRFLELGIATLGDVRALLGDARQTLAALRPTVDGLPLLLRETQGLVADARRLSTQLSPVIAELAKRGLQP